MARRSRVYDCIKVVKRDGREVPFKPEKIINSIWKSAQRIGGDDDQLAKDISVVVIDEVFIKTHGTKKSDLTKSIKKESPKVATITTQEIYEILMNELERRQHFKTISSYNLYRDLSKKIRNVKSLIDAHELIDGYISTTDWRVNENSNMAYSWQGLNNHISTAVQANYWLYKIYPKQISNAHENADIHIHDLGMIATYCCGWDLQQLLMKGFTGVPGKLSCAPPKHFSTALGQIVNFFYTLQHEAAGAQAFSSFDTYLAPFIRYDKLTEKQVKQHLQEFMFNMNVPTRVGCQTPFTNITLDLKVRGILADENVIIGGKLMPEKYGDFQKEMDMFNRLLAEIYTEGDANGRIFTFPIPTYNIGKDFDWDDDNLESVWEMTAKYGIPYFANFVNSDMKPDDVRSMCCRLRIDNRELRKKGGGLFGANPMTGSIGVVTMNLPRIGYTSENKEQFFDRLGELMDIAKDSLVIKRKVVEEFTERGLYPYSRFYLADIRERLGSYWENHFNTIGVLGMNEACLNFKPVGKGIDTDEGKRFSVEVLNFMRDRIQKYQDETGQIFNLEATPGEGTSYRFAKHDRKKYPEIVAQGENVPYYTNSTQLPVGFTSDMFEAMDHQDQLQCLYTGGTVMHLFLGEKLPDTDSVKNLVKKITKNYNMPYFSITPTFSICPVHGYIAGEHEYCPKCDEIIGYVEKSPGEAYES